jgi:hypothetical protein
MRGPGRTDAWSDYAVAARRSHRVTLESGFLALHCNVLDGFALKIALQCKIL